MTIKNAYERIQDSITYRINKLELAEQTIPLRRSSHSTLLPKKDISQLHMIGNRQVTVYQNSDLQHCTLFFIYLL
jgi:hypothetical protein